MSLINTLNLINEMTYEEELAHGLARQRLDIAAAALSGTPAGTPAGAALSGTPAGTPAGAALSGTPAGTPDGAGRKISKFAKHGGKIGLLAGLGALGALGYAVNKKSNDYTGASTAVHPTETPSTAVHPTETPSDDSNVLPLALGGLGLAGLGGYGAYKYATRKKK